jgi:cell wall-associated NlpC family hydrolase
MMGDWTQAYARALKIKWTPEVGARLKSWQRWEGGSTSNSAKNNYMNTKQPMPGSWDAIGNGVQGYNTLAQGALAFAHTISNGNYSPALKQWLATGQGDPSHDLGVWVAGPGGAASPSARTYAAKVLGTHPPVGPETSVTPMTTAQPEGPPSADGAAQIRAQARQNLADIAGGAKATDTLGSLARLIRTLHQARPSVQPPAETLPGASPQDAALAHSAVMLAHKYIGTKYTWGGADPKTGFDCSGLVQYVWKALGVDIPRTTYAQWDAGKPVAQADLKPGDEVFFTGSDPQNGKPGHEGLYIGGGMFIEAPGSGKNVRVARLAGRSDFVGARRFG